MIYDVVIIGGGPAGTAAGVYSARKQLKTLLIGGEFGGQSTVSTDIQNWIGTPHISGEDFKKALTAHLKEYEGEFLTIKEGVWVSQIKKNDDIFSIIYDGGSFEAHSILIATGSTRRKLEVKGAQEYENKGITYCASCDGPLFSGQDVTVIGGGNAALETVAQLVAYCKSVTLLHRSETFRADEITVQKVLTHEKVTVHKNVEVLEVKGEQFVNAIVWKDKTSGSITEQLTSGIFVEIGQIPSTQFAEGFLTLDENKKITIDPWTQRTSVEGIWCAGDASNGLYHQNNIAAGDAVKALEDIYMWLHKKK
jgi:alkyl hydroperoxide reductase subunit F